MRETSPYQTLLVTGGCGFIGSSFVRHALRERLAARLVNVDLLTYAGNLANVADLAGDERYTFVRADIADAAAMRRIAAEHPVDAILNFAAESHVDRSIHDPAAFVRTNVLGTGVLLDVARHHGVKRFVQISTDEVYGSLGETADPFTEETPLAPRSPYSASKASADMLALAYHHTFGLDVVVTRCSNNYGPHQFPEKLIPLSTLNLLEDRPVPVYGDGRNVRDWIHVDDHCSGVVAALLRGRAGEVYNFGGECERQNLDVVRSMLHVLEKPDSLLRFVRDRPGHDFRYAMNVAKARRDLGWSPAVDFERGLEATVRWYADNRGWSSAVLSGEYLDYYRKHYGEELGR